MAQGKGTGARAQQDAMQGPEQLPGVAPSGMVPVALPLHITATFGAVTPPSPAGTSFPIILLSNWWPLISPGHPLMPGTTHHGDPG